MLTSNIVGLDIYNGRNDDIGKIQDVVFDKSDRVVGYVLSVGGFLGMGTHYVAVGPSAVSITYDGKQQDLAGEHERDEGPAQVRARVQVRRRVDGQPELSCRGRRPKDLPANVVPTGRTTVRRDELNPHELSSASRTAVCASARLP